MKPMVNQKPDLKTRHFVDAARCNLEMALMLLNDLPRGYEELEITKAFVRDALFSSLRLGLEVALSPNLEPAPHLRLVASAKEAR
jgi:hypothetical protein